MKFYESNNKYVKDAFKDLLKEKEYNSKKEKLVDLLADLYNTTCDYAGNVSGHDDTKQVEELQNKIEDLQKEIIKIAMKESL